MTLPVPLRWRDLPGYAEQEPPVLGPESQHLLEYLARRLVLQRVYKRLVGRPVLGDLAEPEPGRESHRAGYGRELVQGRVRTRPFPRFVT